MSRIDWNATAAMVQAVFSIVAIGVAIWLGERQHARTRRAIEDERTRQNQVRIATVRVHAIWAATSLRDVRDHAKRAADFFRQITVKAEAQIEGDQIPLLQSTLRAFSIPTSPELSYLRTVLPEFGPEIAAKLVHALRYVQLYEAGLEQSAHLLATGLVNTTTFMRSLNTATERADRVDQFAGLALEAIEEHYQLVAQTPPDPKQDGEEPQDDAGTRPASS